MQKVLFLLFFSLPVFSLAQVETATPASERAYDIVPIEYDFTATNPLRHILPYDKKFVFNFINIPDNVRSFIVRIYVINNESYENSNYKNVDIKRLDLSYVLSLHDNKILLSDSLVRGSGFSGKTAATVFPFKLKPNRNYILEVESFTAEQLNAAQQAELAQKLKDDPSVARFLDRVSKIYIDNPSTDIDDLNELLPDLNDVASAAVKRVDPAYVIVQPDYGTQLRQMNRVLTSLSNASQKLVELKGSFPTPEGARAQEANLRLISSRLQRVNWTTIRVDDGSYRSLMQAIDAVLGANQDSRLTSRLSTLKAEFVRELDNFISSRDQVFDDLIDLAIVVNTQINRTLSATYPQDFVKQAKMYITFDAGLAYVWKLDRSSFYTGLNVYLRPLDKNIPLSQYRQCWDVIATRTSILIGFSVSSVQRDSVRKGLLDDNKALVLGLGFRITPWLKLNGGSYLYYSFDKNPLAGTDRYRFNGAPFVSLSIDIDARSLLNGLADAIFKQ